MTTVTPPAPATPASEALGRRHPRRQLRLRRAGPLTYVLLVGILVVSAFPVYWTFVAASGTNELIARTPPALLPGGHLLENIGRVFDSVPFQRALLNSFIVAGAITVSVVLFCSLAGFAFAKLRFRGRNVLLLAVVATLAVPTQLGIIPLYILMSRLGWTARLPAVIVPFMVTAFGVFLMRQYIAAAVPTELLEAGRVDGASTLRLYWNVVLPAIRPAAAVLGLLTFMQFWNDFFWPLIVLTPENPTVQVALNTLAAGYYQDYSLVLTGTALATLPILAVFALLGRQIIDGIMEGALRG
jgi:cellobiose transport system permease protein